MKKRSYVELKNAVTVAIQYYDAEELLACALELDALGSTASGALSEMIHGIVCRRQDRFEEAMVHYSRALELYQGSSDRGGMASVLGNIGDLHLRRNALPLALEFFERAQAIYAELGNSHSMATGLQSIGYVHLAISNYPEALEYFHRSLAIAEELGDSFAMAGQIANIGLVHSEAGNITVSLEYLVRALALHEELGDRWGIAHDTGNIGTTYSLLDRKEEALEYYSRSLAFHQEVGSRDVALVAGNIASLHVKMRDIPNATAMLALMDDHAQSTPRVQIQREMLRVDLYLYDNDLDAAHASLTAVLEMAKEHSVRQFESDAHVGLRDIALQRNDLAAYVEHNNAHLKIQEETNGKDAIMKIAVQEKQREIDAQRREHEKHLAVLHSTLPKEVADRVARGEVVNDHYDNASVLFLDIVGFTDLSSQLDSRIVIEILDDVFSNCDAICAKHQVTKIKTIGDSYMAVAFGIANSEQRIANSEERTANVMPSEVEAQRTVNPAVRAANAAMEMMNITLNEELEKALNKALIKFRIGIHCGPATAGVIGKERMQYDVWGDTVNVASRMESTSEPGRIHISDALNKALENALKDALTKPHIVPRGEVEIKGKGSMTTFWLEGA